MASEPDRDPVVRQLREQISDNDLAIVNAINKRLKLVKRLKEYKTSRGFEFVDQAREDWMLSYLSRANQGPISAEGLRAIYGAILDLTKREVAGPLEDVGAGEGTAGKLEDVGAAHAPPATES